MVGAGPIGDDRSQGLDVGAAAERIDILSDEIEDLVEPIPDRDRRAEKRIDEDGFAAIALGVQLVLLRDGAAESVNAAIKRAVAIERTH